MPHPGFNLAELLIALALLGVIAVFTIPKVLDSQADAQRNAIAKETAAMVSAAYQEHQRINGKTPTTGFFSLTPYMNYVQIDSTSGGDVADDVQTQTSINCTSWHCMRLHNGAIVLFSSGVTFGGTASTNAFGFIVDPDGTYSGTTNTGKGVQFFIYYNGRIIDRGNIPANTCSSSTCSSAWVNSVPPWFSWN